MSYMGLFWETGMPEAWALSRKSGDGPAAGGRPELDTAALLSSRNMLDAGVYPVIPGQTVVVPGVIADRPAPKPDDEETKGR